MFLYYGVYGVLRTSGGLSLVSFFLGLVFFELQQAFLL